MQQIICNKVIIDQYRIECRYTVKGEELLSSFFAEPYLFKAIYDIDISNVPLSIAVIPFVCNVLPIIWVQDTELIVDELDQQFYESIEKFKEGYIAMYPDMQFKGKVSPKQIINNQYAADKSAVLFSGGVDAFTTLISHIEENPSLITLWGADIAYNNVDGWKAVDKQVCDTSDLLDLDHYIVRTNFRDFILDHILKNYLNTINPKYGWWHDFQHGIGIISHAAPLAFKLGLEKVYIASSFTKNDIGSYTCASDPTIDNYVKFGSTKVVHDGYELNRQMKIKKICDYTEANKLNLPVRVCWVSKDGKNCCKCEKCYRTIMGVLAENKDPKSLGFERYDENIRHHMLKELRWKKISKYNFRRYRYIQDKLRNNYTLDNCPADLKWFYKLKFSDRVSLPDKILLKIISCIRKVKGVLK